MATEIIIWPCVISLVVLVYYKMYMLLLAKRRVVTITGHTFDVEANTLPLYEILLDGGQVDLVTSEVDAETQPT